ncbi:YncE family protein [Modestobacter versicolor]|uniref:DNA-binding beta-propeller fold protein YncE n=1 Tax=Modestobacter versicolor TaxID=429133 RepID=A0A323VJ06_9ACTN|nr:YncE family protein [Modestobacter versicolor]MBB3675199.1 DNA-binding beta-propeller fold protein YncE [Modestobacter versicolor]PZA22986.1 YncE family protein [Modestobacter versicolor]
MPRARFAAVLLPLTLALAGCSSSEPAADPAPAKAAEPADSPELTTDPAGTVVPLDPDAEGMVFDPVTGLLAVAVRDPNRLVLVDRDGTAVLEVPLPGHARHLQLAAPGGPVLVPAEDSNSLVEVSLPDGAVRETPVGSYPHDAAQVASGQVLVGDEKGGTLSVVEDGEVTTTLTSQTQPGGVAVVGDVAGVVDVGAFSLTTYDVPAGELLDVVDAGDGPTHLVADARGRFLVADTRGNAVLTFSADPLAQVGSLPLDGEPYGLALDAADQLLWVTLTGTNEVVALSTAGDELTEVARLPTVRQPNTVAVDPGSGRVFVGSRATGELQLIDP